MKKLVWFFDKKGNVKVMETVVEKTKTGSIPNSVGFSKTSGVIKKAA